MRRALGSFCMWLSDEIDKASRWAEEKSTSIWSYGHGLRTPNRRSVYPFGGLLAVPEDSRMLPVWTSVWPCSLASRSGRIYETYTRVRHVGGGYLARALRKISTPIESAIERLEHPKVRVDGGELSGYAKQTNSAYIAVVPGIPPKG